MRITHGVMVSGFLGDMNTNLNSLNKIQKQLNTGKVFSKPSDDPFKVARSMQMYSEINANKQYNTNIKDTINWMDTTDTALSNGTKCLQRIRELMVSSGNAAYGSSELTAIKEEINERVAEFGQILNTSFDGKYIFGGKDGASKPVEVNLDGVTGENSISISGDENIINKSLKVEISSGVTVDYNVNAVEVLKFKDKAGNDIEVTQFFDDLLNNLSDVNGKSKVVGENLDQMDKVIENMISISAKVGTVQNRMESAKDLNTSQNENLTEILSGNEDIDFMEKSMEMAVARTIYVASLQTSSKVLQPSILDFL
ncbi:MAG: flagellar hook-associated protein 3 [Clostridium sulfidigenes]|uniref:Flagellar hook-associated protein 3 n=1 Tax=Clostridium sulfidigenes TaxID=318464 RepID=A0A927WCP1_9CLOT|nr:flagellar hook-associated protein 3 [Clostridium sulfidigenes]